MERIMSHNKSKMFQKCLKMKSFSPSASSLSFFPDFSHFEMKFPSTFFTQLILIELKRVLFQLL